MKNIISFVLPFEDSVFFSGSDLIGKKYFSFKDEAAFQGFNGLIEVEKLVFNSNFNSSLDFFRARIGGMHISEGLKDAIEILGFTGVRISDKGPIIITTS